MRLSASPAGFVLAAALAAPAAAQIGVYTAPLLPEPSVTSPGHGFATVTIDTTLMTMRVEATFADLVGTTTIGHIHCCTATPFTGTVAPATQLPSFEDFPTGVTAGSYDHTFDMTLASSWNPAFVTAQGGIANAFTAFVDGLNDGRAYLNIHTSAFGSGEIRGFPTLIPEPQTYALMLAGLAAVAWSAKRRRSV
ncbi:CHRD domain-containing protein [Piscinibacter sp. XHJ-5]|uniref:CHRD domain-containing protein n=1 Tax=Piscinibacter sp. XHJ-5 TaxID=3037797 RepID=UPI0024529832|nr:CHRD domain-containing protein [Piscinibacter sp. XHJ-5]